MSQLDPKLLYNRANNQEPEGPVLHVRYEGNSRDIALEILGIGMESADEAVRSAVAAFLDQPVAKLDRLVVERHANGNLTLRPEALFG